MKRCRYWRKRFPEAIYGELDAGARGKMERHLAQCESCAGLYEKMAAAIRKLDARPSPDREPRFWEGYWDRLEARMGREAATAPGRARPAIPLPGWAYGAAGALFFIALGIFIGRTVVRPRPELPQTARMTSSPGADAVETAIEPGSDAAPLAVRASRYLKRSRVLLLAVVNADPRDEEPLQLNLALQKKTSEDLLREAAVLKRGIGSSDRRMERLISELEMILLQIANLAPEPGDADIAFIRAGIESRDVLFKINLSEVRRAAGKPIARRAQGPWDPTRQPSITRTAVGA
jgi:hypothetical protein